MVRMPNTPATEPNYTDNGDGTVSDNITGLMWQQSPDTDGDGDIDAADKLSYDQAVAGAGTLTLGATAIGVCPPSRSFIRSWTSAASIPAAMKIPTPPV